MDKLICTLMTFVVLCVLPTYCDLRSVKDSLNYDVMNGVDVLKLKKRHAITDDKKVPVFQSRPQKQNQQEEKPIKKSVKQNIKPGKPDVQKQEMKKQSVDSTSLLQPNKQSARNPKVLHKIKPRQGEEEGEEDEGSDDYDQSAFEDVDVDSQVLGKKIATIQKNDKNIVNKKPTSKISTNEVVAKSLNTKSANSPEGKKGAEVAEVCVEPTKKAAKSPSKRNVQSKGLHKKVEVLS